MPYPWTVLPTNGTLSYGSFTFDPLVRTRVQSRPIEDDAKRTVVAWELAFEVDAHVTSGANGVDRADATLALMQQQLTQNGLEFHYDGKGFGSTFTVNKADGSGIRDLMWGPKPQLLSFTPLGDNNAAFVTWAVKCVVPFCPGSAKYSGVLMALNYEVDTAIDGDGYTTLTVAGYAEIPMTYPSPGSTTVPDTADAYREQVTPAIPPGFKAVQKSFRLSLDKRRLDFTFSFQQLPKDGIPINCTSATGRHSIRSDGRNTSGWWGNISATYTVSPNKPKSEAWQRFLVLIRSRLIAAKSMQAGIIFYGLSVNEGLYEDGKTSSFELQYRLGTSLQKILQASGLWKPIPDTNFQSWAASIADITGPRGQAGLKHLPGDDAILNLCGGNVSVMKSQGRTNVLTSQPPVAPCPTYLTADTSWLRFRNSIDPDVDANTLRHKPLNPVSLTTFQPDPNGPGYQGITFQPDLIQQRTTPAFSVTQRGYAVRAGFTIPIPFLTSFGSVPVVIADQKVRQSLIGFLGCVPIVKADWYFRYMVIQPPQGIIFPGQNPTMTAVDPGSVIGFRTASGGQQLRTLTGTATLP